MYDFLDLEAEVANSEEEELDDEELGERDFLTTMASQVIHLNIDGFLNDVDSVGDTESERDERPASPEPTDFVREALLQIQARMAQRHLPTRTDAPEVDRMESLVRGPQENDPELWAVRVKVRSQLFAKL